MARENEFTANIAMDARTKQKISSVRVGANFAKIQRRAPTQSKGFTKFLNSVIIALRQ